MTATTPSADTEQGWLSDALTRYSQTRDAALRQQLVERTMWMATRIARRYADRGEPFDDLVQVAHIGLLKAIDRFDPAHGAQFGAFATPTILGELRRHFRDQTWSVHVSRRAKDIRPSVNAAAVALHQELGRMPTSVEIAGRVHHPEDAVREALDANHVYRTRDRPVNPDSIPSIDAGFDFDSVLDRRVIMDLLERLTQRERLIIYLRYFEELSQARIAERVGVSQVHVGRLLVSSLEQLRELAGAASDANA